MGYTHPSHNPMDIAWARCDEGLHICFCVLTDELESAIDSETIHPGNLFLQHLAPQDPPLHRSGIVLKQLIALMFQGLCEHGKVLVTLTLERRVFDLLFTPAVW